WASAHTATSPSMPTADRTSLTRASMFARSSTQRSPSSSGTLQVRDHLIAGQPIRRDATEVLLEAHARVVRPDAIGEQANLAQVGDQTAEHHVAEALHALAAGDEAAPVGAREPTLEVLFVHLVGQKTIAHQQRDLEGPVLALAALALVELLLD